MNNTEFRRLVLDTPSAGQRDASSNTTKGSSRLGSAALSLGSRTHSSIPMTPRTVKGGPTIDFSRQLADQDADSRPVKRFKGSAAPKGVRLGAKYTDRALQRNATEDSQDEMEARVSALEEQMKLGQIDRSTFEQLRDTITGGDVGATHLIKGLDRRLLDRVRKGEDVLTSEQSQSDGKERGKSDEPDAEDELETLEERTVVPVQREESKKKGEMAPPSLPLSGTKRSRNDILAELKASRKAAEDVKAGLGTRFRKFASRKDEPRLERDDKGREVLVTVDEHGRVKRKVRKINHRADETSVGLLMPDKAAQPLGMEVPEIAPAPNVMEDVDIFEGVGVDYDPLGGGLEDDDSSSDEELDETTDRQPSKIAERAASADQVSQTDPPAIYSEDEGVGRDDAVSTYAMQPPPPLPRKTNYFGSAPDEEENERPSRGLDDPAILETLKRAAALQHRQETNARDSRDSQGDPRESSAAQRLFQRDRDLDDMDMGFGGSRLGDEEDDAGADSRIKLSEWKGTGADDGDDGSKDGSAAKQRKRGKKKKYGDKNSASDVLKLMESRKT